METLNNCPACSQSQFEPFLVCKDFLINKKDFQIAQCSHCNFKFTNPRPTLNEISKHYESVNYISHSKSVSLIGLIYEFAKQIAIKNKIKLVKKYVSCGTIIDFGCGVGDFLKQCKNKGWKTIGVEPNDNARRFGNQSQLNVFDDFNKVNTPENSVNAITLWHALEHVHQLDEVLNWFKKVLNKNGALLIAVPNYKSYDAAYFKQYWAAYDLPRHLYHFDISTIKLLLNKYGFTLEKTIPMKFDSFYVSLLSNKYKFNKSKFLNSFLVGLKSNIKAKRTTNYSSVIYVFKPS